MPSIAQPLTDAELDAFEDGRDLGDDLLESIGQMKAGQGNLAYSPVIAARQQAGLSQSYKASVSSRVPSRSTARMGLLSMSDTS